MTHLDINRIIPTPLRAFMIISLMCLRKDSLESKRNLNVCAHQRETTSLPLKIRGGWIGLLFLCEKMT